MTQLTVDDHHKTIEILSDDMLFHVNVFHFESNIYLFIRKYFIQKKKKKNVRFYIQFVEYLMYLVLVPYPCLVFFSDVIGNCK